MRTKLAWALLAATAAAGATALAEDPRPALTDIRQETTDRSTRLVVEANGPLSYTYYSPDPLTLVVDIPEVDASGVPGRVDVGTREVESLRVTTMARGDGRSLARIEVRLASLSPYQIYSKDRNLHLVFERPGENAARGAARKPTLAAADPPAPPPAAPAETRTAEAGPAEPKASENPDTTVKPIEIKPRGAKSAEGRTLTAKGIEITVHEPPQAAGDPPTPPPDRRSSPAGRILGVTPGHEGTQLAITVKADGALRYQDFFLGNPDRLVVDFPDVVSGVTIRGMQVNQEPVRKVRLAQFSLSSPKVARLVLDLSSRAPYRIVEGTDGLKILFGEGQTPSPAPLAALREEAREAETTSPTPEPAVDAPLPAPPPGVQALPEPVLPSPQEPAAPAAPISGTSLGVEEKKYTGQPISLDFKEGDLLDIFRLFADISGLNIVVNPNVSGKVTLKLVNVPWDQALDLILKTNKLGRTLEDNVIRIATLNDLQDEERQLIRLAQAKAEAGELKDLRRRISYAKATDLANVLKQAGALSSRGSINVDIRTNTLIVRDIDAFLAKTRDLIAELDVATPQVEIEARIIVTSRNFTRDIGIQWGFLNQQAAAFGNTTTKSFPHSIILNGQGTPGGGLAADQGGLAPAAGIGGAARGYAVNLPASGFNSSFGVSMGNIIGSFNLDAAITALERQGRGRLLSTPKVTTQNNQAAEIKQGVQIPIQTVANNTVTVSFRDAVLTLKVTPQITDAGTVILNLEVENNAADFGNLVNGIPPINTQSAKTNVLVADGATTVIGGIFQSNETTSSSSTPLLGRLPILGYLFRNRTVNSTNNELLLFITPRIIKS
jgi:type IV pilus assembly protein PilQ